MHRTPKQIVTRAGAREPSKARSARTRRLKSATCRSRSAVSLATHSTTHAACASVSRFSRTRLKGRVMSKWSMRTSSLRPVSKKTSSPSVQSSRALPNRERMRRAAFATPRIFPKSRE
jgi:hypothetical protein